jgi:hypothetical protein
VKRVDFGRTRRQKCGGWGERFDFGHRQSMPASAFLGPLYGPGAAAVAAAEAA